MELTDEDLVKYKHIQYKDTAVMFGLQQGNHVCYLFDGKVMTPSNIQKIASMITGDTNLVKVEVEEKCTILQPFSGMKHENSAAKTMAPTTARTIESIPMGPAWEAKLTENIAHGYETKEKRDLVIKDGNVLPGLARVKTVQRTNLCRLLGATHLVAEVLVIRIPTGKVSNL